MQWPLARKGMEKRISLAPVSTAPPQMGGGECSEAKSSSVHPVFSCFHLLQHTRLASNEAEAPNSGPQVYQSQGSMHGAQEKGLAEEVFLAPARRARPQVGLRLVRNSVDLDLVLLRWPSSCVQGRLVDCCVGPRQAPS